MADWAQIYRQSAVLAKQWSLVLSTLQRKAALSSAFCTGLLLVVLTLVRELLGYYFNQ